MKTENKITGFTEKIFSQIFFWQKLGTCFLLAGSNLFHFLFVRSKKLQLSNRIYLFITV